MEKRKMKLFLIHPVDKPINEKGGQYGSPRHGGRTHRGIDYLAPKGTTVKASEDGVVVKSENKSYVPGNDNNYGEVIVIDHTPDVPREGRHIYTLYAHLYSRGVYKNQKVEKGQTVGRSGNSGMKAAYEGKDSGFHLHFEVRDADKEMDWSGWRGNYENPLGYLCQTTTVEYEMPVGNDVVGFPLENKEMQNKG